MARSAMGIERALAKDAPRTQASQPGCGGWMSNRSSGAELDPLYFSFAS